MDFTIPQDNIDGKSLTQLYNKILNSLQSTSPMKLEITDILSILNFPDDVEKNIKDKRGDLVFFEKKFSPMKITIKIKNEGGKISQNLPGTSALGIIIHTKFHCKIILDKLQQIIIIDNIEGLDADIPGPINPDIDKIIIKVRSKEIIITV